MTARSAMTKPSPLQTYDSWRLVLPCANAAKFITATEGMAHPTIAIAAYLNPDTPNKTPSQTKASAVIGWVSTTLQELTVSSKGMNSLATVFASLSLHWDLPLGKGFEVVTRVEWLSVEEVVLMNYFSTSKYRPHASHRHVRAFPEEHPWEKFTGLVHHLQQLTWLKNLGKAE